MMARVIAPSRTRFIETAFTFIALWGSALSITRYSIPEEMEEGSFVANLATDLGLDVRSLVQRSAKLDVIHSKNYLDINKETGELLIREKIDRENICMTKTTSCFLKMDVILENPILIAIDADSEQNARVTYQLLQITDSTLFNLDQYNGEVRTTRMFSYRDPRQQRLVIVAKDNGDPSLSATVTIQISTVENVRSFSETTELPLEYDVFTDLNLYLVIGLGAVSFLLLITILVIIVLKCQKPNPKVIKIPQPNRNSVISRNSMISQRSSTIADSTLISSDAYWYSLFLAETRKGQVVVRQPIIPKGAGYFVSSIPRSIGPSETTDSRASTLEQQPRRELP
ncbi:hypothetical protein KUCAC02_003101 [Chaenocephalus aceratus]|uniref:Uncharacterized protein n=1 Tax=Chaenocephalus aceratus TaxID=36190 RepID=A0ACB9WKP8_CHAAC|nr:hypothetical protein KUCAC02_003101 [Chaenocephalus aceratus]